MKVRNTLMFTMAALLSVGLASCGRKAPKSFVTTFSTDMYTMDYLNTYHAVDSRVLVNLVDGLVEHDIYGLVRPALAQSWTKTTVEGDDVWTFTLRPGVQWVTNEGEEYAEVVADDFVAGMQHLLDTGWNALGYIVFGTIKNAYEYSIDGTAEFADVGVKAISKYEVQYRLEGAVPYFMKMIQYNPFMPLNRDFFEAQDGELGVEEWADAEAGCSYGRVGIPSSILYNGAYLFTKYASKSVMELSKNDSYWDVDNVKVDSVKYVYDDGSNMTARYSAFKNGEYSSLAVTRTILDTATEEFANSLYVTDTNSTTFYATFNLNRQTYQVGTAISTKTPQEKADTKIAILNKNFRKSVQSAFDKGTWNGAIVGNALKNNSLRNMLTAPEFVSLPTASGTYAAGASYGSVVEAEYKALNPSYTGTLVDGQDAFFNATRAAGYKAAAIADLTGQVTFPIALDIVIYSPSVDQTNQATAFKQSLEATLGVDYIKVNIMGTSVESDFINSSYRSRFGEKSNFDFYYGSGWGPDYGDPLTYLNIFDYRKDMMSVIGIGNADGTYLQDDADAYNAALGDYSAMLAAAKVLTGAARYVAFAELEAYLLDQAVVNMTTTQGGNYALTRVQPRTAPYTLFGTDNEKFKSLVIGKDILTLAQINAYKASWATAKTAAFAAYTAAGPLA